MIIEGTEKIRIYRSHDGRLRRETVVLVRCNSCGSERWLTRRDAGRSNKCKGCAARLALTKVSDENRLRALRQNFIQHMNSSEKMVEAWLMQWQVSFESQAIVTGLNRVFIVDFLVCGDIVVEINGWDHSNRPAIQARDELLMRLKGDKVIFLDAVHNLAGEYQRLKDYLAWTL